MIEHVAEEPLDFSALTGAQQAVVDEDAGQLVADRTMDQRRGDARVHATRQPADDPAVTDLLADPLDGVFDEGIHRPAGASAADAERKIPQHRGSAVGVYDLRVKLNSPDRTIPIAHGRKRRTITRGERLEALGQAEHPVAVAHPGHALDAAFEVRKERIVALDLQQRASIFVIVRCFDEPTEVMREKLKAVTDAEHRASDVENCQVEVRCGGVEHTRRPAGQDDANRLPRAQGLRIDGSGVDLAVDTLLANSPRDQLAVLRAKIEHDDAITFEIALHGGGNHSPSFAPSTLPPGGCGSRSGLRLERSKPTRFDSSELLW